MVLGQFPCLIRPYTGPEQLLTFVVGQPASMSVAVRLVAWVVWEVVLVVLVAFVILWDAVWPSALRVLLGFA